MHVIIPRLFFLLFWESAELCEKEAPLGKLNCESIWSQLPLSKVIGSNTRLLNTYSSLPIVGYSS